MLTWFVNYKDGTRHDYVAHEFTIAQIDKEKIDTLVIHDPNKDYPVLVIHFDDPRKRPIYVRRTEKKGRYNFETICHIVGWQMKINGENIQSISYVFETNGRIIQVQDPKFTNDPLKKIPQRDEVVWVENAGKFDHNRNGWFFKPADVQLGMIGSKLKT